MKFRLDYDPRRNRILIDIRDFWTVETVHAFAAAAGAKAQEVRGLRGDYDVLIDSRDFPVQANDVADLLPSIAEAGLTLTSGRAASVVGSELAGVDFIAVDSTQPLFGNAFLNEVNTTPAFHHHYDSARESHPEVAVAVLRELLGVAS